MPTNINPVSFMSPQALIAPDLAVQQQQAQRQYDLANALRQMSFEPIANNGGNHSWTQGLAKVAQALAARTIQGRTDNQQISLNQAMAQRMGSMFGQPGGGGQSSGVGGGSPQPTPPASIAPPAPTMNVPDAPSAGSSGAPVAPSPTMPQQGQGDPLAAMPPQMAPQQQQAPMAPQPQGYQRGPLSISDNPGVDMMEFATQPEKYWDARNAQIAPVEMARTVQQAQAAMQRGDFATAQALMGQIQKQNYIEPTNVREGGMVLDPITHQPIFQAGKSVAGTSIDYAGGKPVGMHALDGAPQALASVAAADASGKGAGGAGYQTTQVMGADNNMHTIPLNQLPGIGGSPGNGAPSGPASGGLNGYYGRGQGAPAGSTAGPAPTAGNVSGLGPGNISAANTAGSNSANGFRDAIAAGQTAKDAGRSIGLIMSAAKGLPTGTGSDMISELKSGVNAASGAFGGPAVFDRDSIAKFDEMKKNAANLGAQLSTAAGQTGTDARLSNALSSLPGAHYSPQANQEVGLNLQGLAAAANARAQAAAAWQQQKGPGSYAEFQGTWQKAYNPDLFYHMQKGDFQGWAQSMSPAARSHALQQYQTLKSLGAFQ